MMSAVLELKKLTKKYGAAVGVENIDLAIAGGSVVGFLGPNGAGKSTTINMIVDLICPTSGSISVFGMDSVADSVAIRRRIGFLSGDIGLDGRLTGAQQLEYFAHLQGGVDKDYLASLVERLQCQTSKKIKELSRGNRQKIGLVAALMHKPDLLVLDEPTSGLDPLVQAEFNKLIVEHKQAGGSAFVSSHVLSEVQEICDEVAFIRQGRLLAVRAVSSLAEGATKQVALKGASKKVADSISKLSGVSRKSLQGNVLHFAFNGDINALLKVVASHKLQDVTIADTDLESVFMDYYEDEHV
jgi:ABC-2 type transport system ATP-binding protein